MQYVGAAGLNDPSDLEPRHLRIRTDENSVRSADTFYEYLHPCALIDAPEGTSIARWWSMADANSFAPRAV